MGIVCFVDLDDTIIQTEGKCPAGLPLEAAAVDRQGTPVSFMTPTQIALLERLLGSAELVPTTGRTIEALRRVKLAFHSFQITNHGAVITGPDGAPDPVWTAAVYPALRERRQQLDGAAAAALDASQRLAIAARARVIEEHGVPTYVSVKCDSDGALERLAAALDLASLGPGLRQHVNGRNMALLPRETSKRAAVAHVIARLRAASAEAILTVGLGDSLTDAPFMTECDFAMTPRGSQIGRLLETLARDDE